MSKPSPLWEPSSVFEVAGAINRGNPTLSLLALYLLPAKWEDAPELEGKGVTQIRIKHGGPFHRVAGMVWAPRKA